MKILLCAYRDWAVKVYETLSETLDPDHCLYLARDPKEMESLSVMDWHVIVLVGWSWKVPADIVNNKIVIGMHPSDLPKYAGGSPIQNQILDGVEKTNATLFRLNEKFDQGEIVDKEPIDLRGHLTDVFASISDATLTLIKRFIDNFPNNAFTPQEGEKHVVRRLKPENSKLPNPEKMLEGLYENASESITCKELWDFIRCREDPYPNAYFEDETGKLIIKRVEFEPK